MARIKGVDIYLMVNTGTPASPSWEPIGGQKDATFDRGVATIDTTGKDSGGDEEHITGFRNWSISFDAFLIEDCDGFLEIEAAVDTSLQKQFKITTPGSNTYIGLATVESLSIGAPLTDAGVSSFSLKGSGPLVKAP